jgi:TolA-binding protein
MLLDLLSAKSATRARSDLAQYHEYLPGGTSKMVPRLLICALMASPALFGADKTTEAMLEVLRDVGGLQEQIKALQKSLEGRLADLTQAGVDQARAAADQSARSMAALSDSVQKSLRGQQDQQIKTLDAVAAAGSQVQAVADQLSTMRQAMNDLTAAMSRLTTQVSDLTNIVKSLQAKGEADTRAALPSTEISATDLLANAETDRLGGKLDLALEEYTEYASKFGNTDQAQDAQYYIGSIHYSNQEWDDAVKAFDLLLQSYPDSKRAPAGLYYKADSLAKLGRWQDANDTLKDLRKRFPDNPLARQGLTVKPPAHQ